MIWKILIGNLASVALLISLWMHLHYTFYRMTKTQSKLGFGAMMGAAGILSMMLSIQVAPGYYFDLRTTLLAISGVIGGPIALAITTAMVLSCRIMMGGAGIYVGASGIVAVSVISLVVHFALGRRALQLAGIIGAGSTVAIVGVTMSLLFPTGIATLALLTTPMAMMQFVATVLAASVMVYFHRFTLERDILRAALTQAPDFHYVKNLDSEFVVTNLNVAHYNGRQKSSEMVGLTDFDLVPEARAKTLFETEQHIMQSGEPIVDSEERLLNGEGDERWFSTSKVPLRNRQGDMVGLAGVTRDITEKKRLERELLESRNLLSHAMSEMSDGLAMFSPEGVLLFCNEQYRAAFPRSAYARQPGASIYDIVRAVARNGERKDIPTNVSESWIQSAGKELFSSRDTEIPLVDGRWLSVRTRLDQNGSALVVVSDITAIKQSELSLKELAHQMKGLAETDALTGISNRRVFDETIAAESARSIRSGAPMSLLMIDVDRFKLFNDRYGHPEGDKCLKEVAHALRNAARRPTDLAARYGGEEFALLLPETDLAGALAIADAFHEALKGASIVNEASEYGVVTASVGISTMAGSNPFLSPAELVARADEALYRAKHGGRNRSEVSTPQTWPDSFGSSAAL